MSPRIRTTLRLGAWTVAVVAANQVVYTVIVRLATGGTAASSDCSADGEGSGTGYTIYSSAYLLTMAPHAIVTVSLMTASLPGLAVLASTGRPRELARRLAASLRLVMAAIVPVAALIVLLSPAVADLVWGYGTGASTSGLFAPTLACFAIALLFSTAHYVALRGLYALEANKVILGIQVVVGLVNLGLAVVLVKLTDRAMTAPALAVAYTVAYAVGSALSWSVLGHRLGTSEHRQNLGAIARIGLCAAVAVSGCLGLVLVATGHPIVQPTSKATTLVRAGVTTAVFLSLFFGTAGAIRLPELQTLRAALRPDRSPGRRRTSSTAQ
jgi:putative peptidoglycan lipid II flippase